MNTSFWHDWDSFAFWQSMNWRDFTLINISGEKTEYKYAEIHLALLGFHMFFQWFKE